MSIPNFVKNPLRNSRIIVIRNWWEQSHLRQTRTERRLKRERGSKQRINNSDTKFITKELSLERHKIEVHANNFAETNNVKQFKVKLSL
jgi:hypothetical protein